MESYKASFAQVGFGTKIRLIGGDGTVYEKQRGIAISCCTFKDNARNIVDGSVITIDPITQVEVLAT